MENQEALNFNKYKDLIAGSDEESEYGDEEGSDDSKKEAQLEEMRKKLLGGIQAEDKDHRATKDLQEDSDSEELDINFGVGFGEDIGKTLLAKKADKKEEAQKSEF